MLQSLIFIFIQTLEQQRLQEALEKQKKEDAIQTESRVFREGDKLKSEFQLEKEKMVRILFKSQFSARKHFSSVFFGQYLLWLSLASARIKKHEGIPGHC